MSYLASPYVTTAECGNSFQRAGTAATRMSALRMWSDPRANLHPALLALLVFQNLYNPFSPYLTLTFNLCLFVVLLLRNRLSIATVAPLVVATAVIVLIWLCLITLVRGDAEPHVLLKYFRVTAAIVLLALIFGSCKVQERYVVKAINIAFSFHIFLIALQVFWPDISSITVAVFGFERGAGILEQYTMRKLGASGGYDTASLFSIAGLIFFILQYIQLRNPVFLLAVAAAFLAALMSSRMGMLLALLVVIFFWVRLLFLAKIGWKLVVVAGAFVFAVAAYIILVPLFLHSLEISVLQPDDASIVFAATDYGTTGTLEALTQDHLQPLNRPFSELILGYAIDPNTIGKFTDIGYVKLIYHVGIVGTFIIIIMHIYMLLSAYRMMRRAEIRSDQRLLAQFLLYFILLVFIFNYKSLELHSRGAGDLIFLLFFYLSRLGRLKIHVPSQLHSQS